MNRNKIFPPKKKIRLAASQKSIVFISLLIRFLGLLLNFFWGLEPVSDEDFVAVLFLFLKTGNPFFFFLEEDEKSNEWNKKEISDSGEIAFWKKLDSMSSYARLMRFCSFFRSWIFFIPCSLYFFSICGFSLLLKKCQMNIILHLLPILSCEAG